tara:strand:- start:74 stop:466 length:393 start_codon:yes stop_codon:yes gene_type:complete
MQSMNVNELDQLLCDSARQLMYIKAITPITLRECEEVVQDEVNSSISRKIPTIEVEALAKFLFIIFEALDKGMTMEQIAKNFFIWKKELRRQDAIKRTLASAAEELNMPEMMDWMPKSLVCLEGGKSNEI